MASNFKKNKLIFFIGSAVLFLIVIWFLAQSGFNSSTNTSQAELPQRQLENVVLKIDFNPDRQEEFVFKIDQISTVYGLFTKTDYKIQSKDYSFGKLVESIDGVANGQDGKYWIYYVNQQSAKKSADHYKLHGGESILWEFTIPNSPSH